MKKDFTKKIAIATATLLSSVSPARSLANNGDLRLDNSLLVYSEFNRVTVYAPQLSINKTINEDNAINAKFTYDTVSGATPTGEVASSQLQTTTSASGSTQTSLVNTIPKLTFSDARKAITGAWSHTFGRLLQVTLGGSYSTENDYQSQGGNLAASLSSNDKLTTWNLALSRSDDTVDRSLKVDGVAGIPLAGSLSSNLQRQSLQEHKSQQDIVFGISQVLTRKALLQVSLTQSQSQGYHTDPYKLMSVVDSNGYQVSSLYEKRPRSRKRNTLFAQLLYYTHNNVLKSSYRYYQDDWGVLSHTLELKYQIKLAQHAFIEPTARYYQQKAADFHYYYLNTSDSKPDFFSADARLAQFISFTLGARAGVQYKNWKLSARFDYMNQFANPDTSQAPAQLQSVKLFPDLTALISQINLSFYF